MSNKKEIRYTLDGEEASAEGRLLKEYGSGRHSKKAIIGECLTAGYIMKEAGLADMLAVLDADPSFRSASGLVKRERIISMLVPTQPRFESQPAARQEEVPATATVKEPSPKPKAILPTLGS